MDQVIFPLAWEKVKSPLIDWDCRVLLMTGSRKWADTVAVGSDWSARCREARAAAAFVHVSASDSLVVSSLCSGILCLRTLRLRG
ncbi:hypothetical protein GCM10010381_62120 [Streptomyces xantholiticus]|nr:hypothetical protein GCM10010381_62120 [Streptomyces xantholiticus]